MVTGWEVVTGREVTVKVALVALAPTVTDDGTVATDVADEVSVTTAPPEGARPLSVTVAIELARPPTSSAGDRATD
jgi:hypothetical protein